MFSDSLPQLGDFEFLLFISPESRCLNALDSVPKLGRIVKAWKVDYTDYDEGQPSDLAGADKAAILGYRENRKAVESWLVSKKIESTSVVSGLKGEEPFDDDLGPPSPFSLPLVVDISCTPRGRLLALLEYLSRCQAQATQKVYLLYSMPGSQAHDEAALSYGIHDVIVIPGFPGQIRLRQDALILVLGFEGSRALSLYKRLMPTRTILILGDSGDEQREYYLENSRANNHSLLSIHGNTKLVLPSRDPISFAKGLSDYFQQEPLSKDRYNVYFSCLGTKLQTLGAFWFLRQHPMVQALDTLPTRRRVGSHGKGRVLIANLGTDGLLRGISNSYNSL